MRMNRRWGLATLALVFTLALWIFMQQSVEPMASRVFRNVEVQVRGLSANQIVLQPPPPVDVKVRGPADVVASMPAPVAWVQVPSDKRGDLTLEVNVDLPGRVLLVYVKPSAVVVKVDTIVYKQIPIKVYTESGQDITSRISILPDKIVAHGPQTYLENIRYAKIVLKEMPHKDVAVSLETVVFVDSSGNPVRTEGISFEPPVLRISPIEETGRYVLVPIVPQIENPLADYFLMSIQVQPQFAVVKLPATETATPRKLIVKTNRVIIDREPPPDTIVASIQNPSWGYVIYPADVVTVRLQWEKAVVHQFKRVVGNVVKYVLIKCPESVELPDSVVDKHGIVRQDLLPPMCVVVFGG